MKINRSFCEERIVESKMKISFGCTSSIIDVYKNEWKTVFIIYWLGKLQ